MQVDDQGRVSLGPQEAELVGKLTGAAQRVAHRLGRRRGSLRRLPFAGGWLAARDFPVPAARSFQAQYAEQFASTDAPGDDADV